MGTKRAGLAQQAAGDDNVKEDASNELSARLKKSHATRTAALFKDDDNSKHVLKEAERAGLSALG